MSASLSCQVLAQLLFAAVFPAEKSLVTMGSLGKTCRNENALSLCRISPPVPAERQLPQVFFSPPFLTGIWSSGRLMPVPLAKLFPGKFLRGLVCFSRKFSNSPSLQGPRARNYAAGCTRQGSNSVQGLTMFTCYFATSRGSRIWIILLARCRCKLIDGVL